MVSRNADKKRQLDAELKALRKKRKAAEELRNEKLKAKVAWSIVRHSVMAAIAPGIGNGMLAARELWIWPIWLW
jgi:hypothetical protein